MKHIFFTLLILGLSISAFGQKAVTIYKHDGTVTKIKASNIDSITFNTPPAIGDSYQGGIIFYLDASGDHGLIAAPFDQSSGFPWDESGSPKAVSLTTAVGFGYELTCAIIHIAAGVTAATLCYNLTLNGYSDWYLPSLGELVLMYQKRTIIGGFTEGTYWSSSSPPPALSAFGLTFSTGGSITAEKITYYYVRAIRSF